MSPDLASGEQQSASPAAFVALVKYLGEEFGRDGVVSLPSKLVAPFENAFRPTDSFPLRDLLKVLETGRPPNILRLDPRSFCFVVSMVSRFPFSLAQSKLFYLFMNIIRQYRDDEVLAPILSRIHAEEVTSGMVRTQRDYISQQLAPSVLHSLVSSEADLHTRWRLGQLLSVILWENDTSRIRLGQGTQWRNLAAVLQDQEDYFLRILVANIIRLLTRSGQGCAAFKDGFKTLAVVHNAALANATVSTWMAQVLDYLSETGVERAFPGESERVYRIHRLEDEGKTYFDSSSACIAAVTGEIDFLIPDESDMLTVFSIPMTQDMALIPIASESESSLSAIVEISYAANTGWRILNGMKSAIDRITLTFSDEESMEAFRQKVEEQRTALEFPMGSKGGSVGKETTESKALWKHSMAVIDMTLDSADDRSITSWAKEGMSNNGTTSDEDILSPLQTKGLVVVSPTWKNQVSSPARSVNGTGDATPSMKKPHDTGSFLERLHASQKDSDSSASAVARIAPTSATRMKAPKSFTEGATRDSSTSKPAVRTSTSVHQERLQGSRRADKPRNPDPVASITSVPRPLKAPAAESKPNSGKRRSGTTDTTAKERHSKSARTSHSDTPRTASRMTRSISPGGVREGVISTLAAPGRPTLKRRAPKEPASATDSSKPLAKSSSVTGEYDFPSIGKDNAQPGKKAKRENTKQPLKKSHGRGSTVKEKVRHKGRKSDNVSSATTGGRPGTATSPEKLGGATVASTRARRAAKTPKYVEESDSSDQDAGNEVLDVPAEQELAKEVESPGERAEDAHPLSKESLEIAGKASNLSFEQNLQEVEGTADYNFTDTSSVTSAAAAAAPITPKHSSRRLSEGPIPPVSEKLFRKTPIVHFEPHGPSNQAIPLKPYTEAVPETTLVEDDAIETWDQETEPPRIGLIQEEDVPEHDIHSVRDDSGLPEAKDGKDSTVAHDYPPALALGESSSEVSDDQEASEYADSEVPGENVDTSHASYKSDGSGPLPPLLDDEPLDEQGKVKKATVSQAPTRRSIGISAILDEEYPQAERIINTRKMRASLPPETDRSAAGMDSGLLTNQHALRSALDQAKPAAVSQLAGPTGTLEATATPMNMATQASTVGEKIERMGPPPRRSVPCGPIALPHSLRRTNLAGLENKPSYANDRIGNERPAAEKEKPANRAPMRIKNAGLPADKATLFEADPFPATPLSFCTRLDMKAPIAGEDGADISKLTLGKGKTQQAGDGSVTLIDDDSVFATRSAVWARRDGRQRSESSDDRSSVASPSQQQRYPAVKNERLTRELSVRDSQRGLLDAMLRITNDVLFRFGEEEDAVKAKVAELYHGGDDIIQTLTDSWNERLGHEHQSLFKGLAAEKDMVSKAVELIGGQEPGLWKDIILKPRTITKTGCDIDALTERVKAWKDHR